MLVTVLVGSPTTSSTADGIGLLALFQWPVGVSLSRDSSFALVVEGGGNVIRRVAIVTAEVTMIAGSGVAAYADGVGVLASFRSPQGVVVSSNSLFALIADTGNNCLRRIDLATASVSTVAGGGSLADGTGAQAQFSSPFGAFQR